VGANTGVVEVGRRCKEIAQQRAIIEMEDKAPCNHIPRHEALQTTAARDAGIKYSFDFEDQGVAVARKDKT
jgi:hypothetical protein